MHVVAEESDGPPLQATRPSREAIAVRFDFRNVVFGADRDGAQWPRMRVGRALVIHRDVEEAGSAQRLAVRLDFLQMAPERFLPLVETEDGLKRRRPRHLSRRMTQERVVHAMTNRAFESLVEDPALAHAVELLQLRLELLNVAGAPLLNN